MPYTYTAKTKCSLDKNEISWEAIQEKAPVEVESIKEDDTEFSFVMINSSSEEARKLNDEFVIVDLPVASKGDRKIVESLKPSIDYEFVILRPSILSSAQDMESLEEDSIDHEFESLTLSDKDVIDTNSDFHTTFDHLLKDTNSTLKSGTTSTYLNSIKNTYPNFIYNDGLMYGNVPITTDNDNIDL